MIQFRFRSFLAAILSALILAGCGSPAADVTSPRTAQPSRPQVKLVPLGAERELRFKMLYPEGAQVQTTMLQDSVQISRETVFIHVRTEPLRGAAPLSVAEAEKKAREWAPGAQVTERAVSGAASAFELRFDRNENGKAVSELWLDLYGERWYQSVRFAVPAAEYAAWEPLFREMMASFQPSNLDAEVLPRYQLGTSL